MAASDTHSETAGPPIRDAATLVIVDRQGGEPRILLGRRRPDQVFLPNVFVFPGGRADDDDKVAPSADELAEAETALLQIPAGPGTEAHSPAHARGLALAAIRETYEETGLLAGVQSLPVPSREDLSPAWAAFAKHGVLPQLSRLQYFLRAITPRARPRRYDTRFFLVDASAIAAKVAPADDELSEVGWFSLAETEGLEVPRMTKAAIREIGAIFNVGLNPPNIRRVPFYFEQEGVMQRAELSLGEHRS